MEPLLKGHADATHLQLHLQRLTFLGLRTSSSTFWKVGMCLARFTGGKWPRTLPVLPKEGRTAASE